ncbi:glycosyltransferase [Vreelandella aquamarina]|uniref:glycosyltransferase n=1 Tax=Vreelandella aquamarina TaxID=77097 RepID=UPI00384E9EE3
MKTDAKVSVMDENAKVVVDENWYREAYPDVELTGLTPQEHYHYIGRQLGRKPKGDIDNYFISESQRAAIKQKMLTLKKRPARYKKKAHHRQSTEALRYALIEQLSVARNEHTATPYYKKLIKILKNNAAIEPLVAIQASLQQVELQRQGQVPNPSGPLVSIVMPTWNRADLINDAISSIFSQTYQRFELLICDDASSDKTVNIIESLKDERIKLFKQTKRQGAAAARNRCLENASGEYIAYLDSDNIWHPRYLELMLEHIAQWPNHGVYYADYLDVQLNDGTDGVLKAVKSQNFHLEDQIEAPYIDLNSIVHGKFLYDLFGGFDESLKRRQDYELLTRYCWGRAAKHIPLALNLYQRIPNAGQITEVNRNDVGSLNTIERKIQKAYEKGQPVHFPDWVKKVTVISWDMSRNHFAKAYSVAEALSQQVEVELVSFRFFEVPVFKPLEEAKPSFTVKYFEGADFPEFFDTMAKAVNAIEGDVIYCVKPRLTSFGVALLANYHKGTPIFLEANDLETVVASPKASDQHIEYPLEAVFEHIQQAQTPYELIWSQVLEPCVAGIPTLFTHNVNLDIHYGRRAHYMRNIKDASVFNPARFNRENVRKELGFQPEDKVIFFGGLVRKHKGIFELVKLLEKLKDPSYKLLVVGSRETPDLQKLVKTHKNVQVLPPQPPEKMAELNYAADFVVLWLDPAVRASHYQSPYKMSDALAMGPAIIASPISDQAGFAHHDIMWQVPFGDFDALVETIKHISANPEERKRRQQRARQLFLREFSYQAVPSAFARGAVQVTQTNAVYPIAERFAHFFSEFEKRSVEIAEGNTP